MKLYVQKPGGWTQANPQGVFMEKAVKVSPNGKTSEYEVFYRVVPDVEINVDTKHRQPVSPLTVRTGLRIRKENWEAPGPHVMGHGSVLTLKENYFSCLDCQRKLPVHLESKTESARDFEYRRMEHGRARRDIVVYSESKIAKAIPYRNKFSYSSVCTKCANKRVRGETATVHNPVESVHVPAQVIEPHTNIPDGVTLTEYVELRSIQRKSQPSKDPILRTKKVEEKYGMIVSGRHGGNKLKIGGQNVIRREDIELYNLAIMLKRKSTASLKPRIHKAA